MNRSSNNVCEYAVSHIFKKSTGVIRDKETVKQKLFPHTNDATH